VLAQLISRWFHIIGDGDKHGRNVLNVITRIGSAPDRANFASKTHG